MTLVNGATVALVYLVELFPYDPVSGQIVPQYLASDNYTTGPTDAVPNQSYDAVVYGPQTNQNHLFTPGTVGGKSDASRGAITLYNPSDQLVGTDQFNQPIYAGRYDVWKQYRWSGRTARILVGAATDPGAPVTPYSQFTVIFTGQVSAQPQINRDDISVPIANALDRMNKTMQLRTYGGTGGVDGNTASSGKFVPQCFGQCREVPGILFDDTNVVFQVHDGLVYAINAANNRGAPIAGSSSGDYPTYAALIAASLTLGQYATCLAQGMVRLGSAPSMPITFDVQGDATGGVYAQSAARIVERIMTKCFGLVAGTDYDPASIAALDALQPAVCGYWTGLTAVNGLNAIDAILGGIGCWYTAARGGLVQVGRIDAPTITGPTDPNCKLAIDPTIILDNGVVLRVPPDPPSQVTIYYRQFYQTQTTNIAGSVSSSRIADLQQQWRGVPTVNTGATALFPNATPVTVNSPFDAQADAQAEAARLITVIGPAVQLRDVFEVQCFTDPYAINLGDQVWLTHTRYQLSAGKAFIVIGMEEDGQAQTVKLILWG
jgi:hypothetical protein